MVGKERKMDLIQTWNGEIAEEEKRGTCMEERIVKKLTDRGMTVTTAESCTAGLLAGRLMNVSGASAVYNEGYITYANASKEKILKVRHETLETYGAVSEETAEEMARGAAAEAEADAALSVTGVAGPLGGTEEKPVGLVYIGCYLRGLVVVKECRFAGTREENRMASVEAALLLLEEQLDKTE